MIHPKQQLLIDHLEKSWSEFETELASLTAEQWGFRPDHGAWSIGEVAEHICIVEQRVNGMLPSLLESEQSPPSTDQEAQDVVRDVVSQRSTRISAPDILHPRGDYSTPEDLLAAARAQRKITIEISSGDYYTHRKKTATHPVVGILDMHQWLLIVSGHMVRHTGQICEIKRNARYPG